MSTTSEKISEGVITTGIIDASEIKTYKTIKEENNIMKTREEKIDFLTGKGRVEHPMADYKKIDPRLYRELHFEIDNPEDDDLLVVNFKDDGKAYYKYKRVKGMIVVEETKINKTEHELIWWETEWLNNWVEYFEEKDDVSKKTADLVEKMFGNMDTSNQKEHICGDEEFDNLVDGANQYINVLSNEIKDMIKNLHIDGYEVDFTTHSRWQEVYVEVTSQNGLVKVVTMAKCRPSDQYSKTIGKVIALRRVYKMLN